MLELVDQPTRTGRSPLLGERAVDSRARMDRRLFARRDAGDPRAWNELIERFLPLARSLARRYERRGEPLEDLVQVASLALVKAIDGYDCARGVAFSSYAVPTIVGECGASPTSRSTCARFRTRVPRAIGASPLGRTTRTGPSAASFLHP